MLPVVLLVCLTLLQVVAAGVTRAMAGHAAGQGAIALAEGTDPEDAVRDALPGWSRRHLQVRVRAGEVTVRVRPVTFVPGLAERLTSTSQADAGRTS